MMRSSLSHCRWRLVKMIRERISLTSRSTDKISSDIARLMSEELQLDNNNENAEWKERLSRLSKGSCDRRSRSRISGLATLVAEKQGDGNLSSKLLGDYEGLDRTNDENAKEMVDIFAPGNKGIAMSYFSVGFGLYFIMTPVQFYMVDTLDATAGQQSVVIGLLSLPWALKICFGFITDSCPIYGLRRKPYFLIGWLLYAFFNSVMAFVGEPSLPILAACIFLMTCSFVQADVCTDAIIVERSKAYENDETRGTLQATGYQLRFAGSILGAAMGAVLYNQDEWGWGVPFYGICLINAGVPLCLISPFVTSLIETKTEDPPPLSEQLESIWELVQRKAVWQPCTFIFIYNVLFLTNPAWNSFLVNGLGFTEFELGLLTLTGCILSFVGIVVYKNYLFGVPWPRIYIFTAFVGFLFSSLQLVLVLKSGDLAPGVQVLFAMGSYGIQLFVQAVQFLPSCRMFLIMCPEGAEGATYAMLTTLANLAGTMGYSVAAAFATVWDVSSDTLSDGDYSGMWKLTLLIGCVQLGGLPFVKLLPSSMEEQIKMQQSDVSSKCAGRAYLGVVIFSLIFVIAFSVITIIYPY